MCFGLVRLTKACKPTIHYWAEAILQCDTANSHCTYLVAHRQTQACNPKTSSFCSETGVQTEMSSLDCKRKSLRKMHATRCRELSLHVTGCAQATANVQLQN